MSRTICLRVVAKTYYKAEEPTEWKNITYHHLHWKTTESAEYICNEITYELTPAGSLQLLFFGPDFIPFFPIFPFSSGEERPNCEIAPLRSQ
jgi:hypothetical protein